MPEPTLEDLYPETTVRDICALAHDALRKHPGAASFHLIATLVAVDPDAMAKIPHVVRESALWALRHPPSSILRPGALMCVVAGDGSQSYLRGPRGGWRALGSRVTGPVSMTDQEMDALTLSSDTRFVSDGATS